MVDTMAWGLAEKLLGLSEDYQRSPFTPTIFHLSIFPLFIGTQHGNQCNPHAALLLLRALRPKVCARLAPQTCHLGLGLWAWGGH